MKPDDGIGGSSARDDASVDAAAFGVGKNLGLTMHMAPRWRDDASIGVPTCVHESKCDDAVEPGVGDFVEHVFATLAVDLVFECLDCGGSFGSSEGAWAEHGGGLGFDGGHQFPAGPGGEAL